MALSSQDDLYHHMDPSTNNSDAIVEKSGEKMPPQVELKPMIPGTLIGRSNHLSYPGGPIQPPPTDSTET